MISAKELIEVRVRTPMSIDDLKSMLKNTYFKAHRIRLKPGDFDVLGERLYVWTNPIFPFPGIVLSNRRIETGEFERNTLRGTGWSISSASLGFARNGIRIELESQGSPIKNKPDYLYHATPTKFIDDIIKRGLIPQTRPYDVSFRYAEPRIYFVSRLNFKLLKRLISDKEDVKDFTIFMIDTRKFNKFNLWPDDASDSSILLSKFPFSVYTKTHIPPNVLEMVYRVIDGEIIKY